jgi:outer membrane receptor protein involved in Fe transport
MAAQCSDCPGGAFGPRPLVVIIVGLVLAGPASGQDEQLVEILVTGSRIARPDFESISPIVNVPKAAFERTGATSVDTVLNRFPQFVPDFTSTSNGISNGGQGNLQLRGLGTRATLVLVNGRRLIPANGTGVVDVNIVPSTLIDSVEIITGGASAVYGSDAMAGVVNFKLKQDFAGLQFDGSFAQTDRGDGDEYSAAITAGMRFAGDRGRLLGYAGYSERQPVRSSARDFSRHSLYYAGPGAGGFGPDGAFLAGGFPSIEEGAPANLPASLEAFDALFESYGYPSGTVPYQGYFGVNSDGSLFTLGDGTPGSVANFRGERDPLVFNDRNYGFDPAPWGYLQLPLERTSAYGRASFAFDAGHELYGEALYASYTAEQALGPAPSYEISIPSTNPFIPADLKFLLDSRKNRADDVLVFKRFSELGPRIASHEYDVYQLTAGLHGPLSDRWRYEAYVQHGQNDWDERQQGNALRSRINDLSYAPDGGASICGEFSLLGIGRMPQACIDYIATGGVNRQGYEQTVLELSADGAVTTLPAGEIHVALGVMHKRDDYFYDADPIASVTLKDGLPDIIGFDAADDIEGADHNTDIFVEALVPLLANRPGVQRLEAVLGFRRSEYQSAGGANSWKAELLYQPVEPLRLRGSLQRAVRAPSVFELYQPRLPISYDAIGPFALLDPCEAISAERTGAYAAQVEALCLAQGVPESDLARFADGDRVHHGVEGGNPELDPEAAETLTVGFVLKSWSSSEWLAGMRLSVDWYRFEIREAIEYVFAPDYVPLCFDARTNPDFSASNVWCGHFSRNAAGELEDLTDVLVNIDGYDVSGVDLQFDWVFAAGPGEVGLNALVSWMDRFEVIPPPGLAPHNKVGHVGFDATGPLIFDIGGSRPEWKGRLELQYAWGPLMLGTQWRYVDAMQDANSDANYGVPSHDYLDVYAGYVFRAGRFDGLTIRAGVENLADEDPPLLPSSVNANTDASQYDVLGRRYYVNLSYRF